MASVTLKTLPAGEPGTKKLFKEFGEKLVCVRYKYDAQAHKKLKTVELIVDEQFWDGKPTRIPFNKLVDLKVAQDDNKVRQTVENAGGKWNAVDHIWKLKYGVVKELGLEDHIVEKPVIME